MAVRPAVKVRLRRILDGLRYVHDELVKTVDGQITLSDELDLDGLDSKLLGELQNIVITMNPRLEDLCGQLNISVGAPMPVVTESIYSKKGYLEKETIYADESRTEKVQETLFTYSDDAKPKLLNSQTTVFGAVGGQDSIEVSTYLESAEADGGRRVIKQRS